MPTSYVHQIPTILDFAMHLDPRSVLDIGTGFGKYGFLLREYLEVWGSTEGYGAFRRRIDGIEAYPRYLTPVHRFAYNKIYEGDARTIVPKLRRHYDLVLMVDVIEHFTKAEGKALLRRLLKDHGGILVATPKHVEEQDDAFGNPFEEHRSQWDGADFRGLAPCIVLEDPLNWIVYLSRDADETAALRASYRKHRLKARLSRHAWLRGAWQTLRRRGKE